MRGNSGFVVFASGLMNIFSMLAAMLIHVSGLSSAPFPIGPNAGQTPGSLCDHADSIRYPERIAYCARNVDPMLKAEIIRTYDNNFGYSIQRMNRADFKIDHYIPLCAGGSNLESNLWPQHKSIYAITDPLEPLICEKMAAGRLSQQQAVIYVKRAKNNLREVQGIIQQVNSL